MVKKMECKLIRKIETDNHVARRIMCENILGLVRDNLLEKDKDSFVRVTKEGLFLIRKFGENDVEIYNYKQEESLNFSIEEFKIYVYQILSLSSCLTYNSKVSQTCSVMIDNTLLFLKTVPESQDIDIKLVV